MKKTKARIAIIVAAIIAIAGCVGQVPDKAEIIAENLQVPWSIDFLPDGSIIFTERAGNVSIIDSAGKHTIGTIAVSQRSESGLHGIAVDPDFEQNSFVYLYYTHESGNRISRFTLGSNLTNETVLLGGIPHAQVHDGGRIKFGPDGLLYITTGDATDPPSSQILESLAGKILRMDKNGNPEGFFGNYVYSYGHRNPQGLAWGEGIMYASEHGPSSHDEINIIVAGGNYGWPETCELNAMPPIRCYTEFTLAPSGIAFHDGSLYVAGLRGMQLRKLVIKNGTVESESVFLEGLGRIRDVVEKGGYLYITTNNRDGRGIPQLGDDKILRIKIS